MVPTLFFYPLMLIALVWLCLMLQWAWPSAPALSPTTPEPPGPRPKRQHAPTPFTGSPQSLLAMPVSMPVPLAHRHPQPRPPAWCPRGGDAVRWTPPCISAPTRTVPIGAGWVGGISAPMAILTAVPGDSCCASCVTATLTLLVNALMYRLGSDLNRDLAQVEQSVPPSFVVRRSSCP
jgi:hypothetical protein